MSVLRTGRGRVFPLRNVPGVLKRKKSVFFPYYFFFQKCSWGSETHFGGGGCVWGAPRPHPGVVRGRKTIHFFL